MGLNTEVQSSRWTNFEKNVCELNFSNSVGILPGFDEDADASSNLFRSGI